LASYRLFVKNSFALKFYDAHTLAVGLVIGAVVANVYTLIISMIESAKEKADF
jgi:hypothetical protein